MEVSGDEFPFHSGDCQVPFLKFAGEFPLATCLVFPFCGIYMCEAICPEWSSMVVRDGV